MKLDDRQLITYLANVLHVARADGVLKPREQSTMESPPAIESAINFRIDAGSVVRVEIAAADGRAVRTLVAPQRREPGYYSET